MTVPVEERGADDPWPGDDWVQPVPGPLVHRALAEVLSPDCVCPGGSTWTKECQATSDSARWPHPWARFDLDWDYAEAWP